MNVAILSFSSSQTNYGQLLQCFALEEALRKLGHTAFHVQYTPRTTSKTISAVASHPIKALAKLGDFRYLTDKIRVLRRSAYPDRGFDAFRENYLRLCPPTYSSIDELRRDPPDAEAYIVGSDQVWGFPCDDPNTEGWFLHFGLKDVRRISYAASVGRTLTEKEVPVFANLLSKLDHISVREDSVKRLCARCGFESDVVLDPTLLLSAADYESLFMDERNVCPAEAYLFAYILNIAFSRDMHWNQVREYVQSRRLSIVPVYSSGYYSQYPVIAHVPPMYPSIPQWLSLVRNAESVVTSSFHGTVFSILFERPFLSIPLPRSRTSRGGDRIETLLKSLGIEDRIFNPKLPLKYQMDAPIDWALVRSRLKTQRSLSFDYLKNSLS
ncbi:polysaccharide pyruvyl transferase family protein [Thermophilibacter sp.]